MRKMSLEQLRANGVELWISRQVVREYLAVLTRPQTFAIRLTRREVVAAVREFLPQFQVAEDSVDVSDESLRIVDLIALGGRQVHDANIVATMRVHQVGRLLTHNPEDFARFSELIPVVPLVGP